MRRTIRAVLALAAVGSALTAWAQPIEEYNLNIDRLPLKSALTEFSQQTGLRISFLVQNSEQRDTLVGPISGRYTLESALSEMAGEGEITFVRVNERMIAVTAKSGPRLQPIGLRFVPARLAALDAAQVESGSVSSSDRPERGRDIEEVIVSAQKRNEKLEDVPISISVLSGVDLDRSTASGISEALSRVPGVATTVAQQGGGTQVVIRGVTAGGPLFNGSSPIAYYIDSVPFGLVKTAIAPDTNAYDLQQVEVLRGPQGTLYGATAQNGVVRILTQDADLKKLDFKARTSGSNTQDGSESYRGDVAFNIPIISEKVAARVVLGYQELGGWIDKPNNTDVNDAQLSNVRLKVNGQATDNLTIGVSAWLSRSDYGAPPVSNDDDRSSSVENEGISSDYDAYGLKIGYDGASLSVASMTSYLKYGNSGAVDFAPAGFADELFTDLDADVFSQEFILNSASEGGWRWSLGAFYRDAEDRLRQNALGGGIPFDYGNASESYSVFGEFGHRFAENKFEWTLGLRYFHDDVTLNENISQGPPGEPAIHKESSFNSTTPRVVLTWFPTDDLTVYGSYSEGFRSGFSQDPGVIRSYATFPDVKPDTLRNYEIGFKGNVPALTFDAAVYFIDWRDVQQTLTVPYDNTNVTALVNGQSASGFGVDLAISTRPVDGVELGVSGSYNDLTMDNVVLSEGLALFQKGDRLNYSPEYTLGASAEYEFIFGGTGLGGRFSVSGSYSSEQIQRTSFGGVYYEGLGDSIFTGQTSFAIDSSGGWTATLFVDNVSNERGTPMRDPFGVPDWSLRVRPRTYGVQLEYQF